MVIVGALVVGVAVVMTAPEPPQHSGGGGGGGGGGVGGRGRRLIAPQGAVPVLVAEPAIADVPVYLEGVGTTRALNLVTVRSQVDGKLISVNFREGEDVRRGDVLARIDSTTYKAQLDQTLAQKAVDEAKLANARLDLARYTDLVKTNAVTRQQVDTTRALVAQMEAQVRLDQGAIDNARALLDYCTIAAPIDGRAGIRLVDLGNIIHAADPTGIVVLTQIQPIAVLFILPQQLLSQVNKAFAAGPLPVEATESDGKKVLDHGKLQVINNQVDQTTGTVQMKAEFPNRDLQLWPGQFVNVRLLIDTLRQVLVVPTAAVQHGPNGTFVYQLKPDSTVAVRSVVVKQQDENQAVIASGMELSDRVVTTGFAQLAEGRLVLVQGEGREPSGTASSQRGQGQGGGQGERRHRGERRDSGATQGKTQ
jgi:multidrug efflux system membrane fusion protein